MVFQLADSTILRLVKQIIESEYNLLIRRIHTGDRVSRKHAPLPINQTIVGWIGARD
jgi:hypothetical protein